MSQGVPQRFGSPAPLIALPTPPRRNSLPRPLGSPQAGPSRGIVRQAPSRPRKHSMGPRGATATMPRRSRRPKARTGRVPAGRSGRRSGGLLGPALSQGCAPVGAVPSVPTCHTPAQRANPAQRTDTRSPRPRHLSGFPHLSGPSTVLAVQTTTLALCGPWRLPIRTPTPCERAKSAST